MDLDTTLAALLADESAPSESCDAEVSFITPGKDFNPTPATVNVFLHGVQGNLDLRTGVSIGESIAGSLSGIGTNDPGGRHLPEDRLVVENRRTEAVERPH